MAQGMEFSKLEKVAAKVKPVGATGEGVEWWDIVATTKSGTKYKMQFPLPTLTADSFMRGVKARGFIYPDSWKEIKP
jgi:hypothetical protein